MIVYKSFKIAFMIVSMLYLKGNSFIGFPIFIKNLLSFRWMLTMLTKMLFKNSFPLFSDNVLKIEDYKTELQENLHTDAINFILNIEAFE